MRVWTLSVLLLLPQLVFGQAPASNQASCTVIYALKRSANVYFNDEIIGLENAIHRQKVRFIDLNSWRKTYPHIEISGRVRNQLREKFSLPDNINQAIVLDKQGQIIKRYTGSVTLVNVLIDCREQR